MEFKIGDWVRSTKANKNIIMKIARIPDRKNTCYNDKDILDNGKGAKMYSNECELWKPKEHEWCWFWDEGMKPVLSKYVRYLKVLGYVSEGAWYQKEKTGWQYCEPFIGELPSYIQEKEGKDKNA